MNWKPGYDEIITLLFLGATSMYLWELAKGSRIKGILRAALRKADDGVPSMRVKVQLERNQVAEMLGERPVPRLGEKFTAKFDPIHPTMRSATKRRKMGRGWS